ncbi:unnamed protein product [Parascedosporium putredinis]|uniref:Helicase C-terminal domain-containing protein n=1 Tax=Parascedosporium putredinis TaxID=1442378 RepID=A0A9P1HBE2_9PEZI|nr:unnamed protein product [Parascedosporium putredinis]CAI8003829.1 unnamed protein product [Parascedosporium putredinis]
MTPEVDGLGGIPGWAGGEDVQMDDVYLQSSTKITAVVERIAGSGIGCEKYDGRVKFSDRQRRLDMFYADPLVRVLLLTIQSGAVGLNITAANYVHMMEPQWNPAVEDQAIARVIRMGQKRKVTIVRYVVKGTVEENLVAVQGQKKKLARSTMTFGEAGGGAEDDLNGKLEELKFILGKES